MPNVPHIVGDDDDLSEADDQAQIPEAHSDRTAALNTAGAPTSVADQKTIDSPSSELSDSSYDNESDAE